MLNTIQEKLRQLKKGDFPAMSEAFTVVHYERNGHDIFQDWLDGLKDLKAKTAIARIVKRVEKGNFGEHKP